jgi:hypothetical protein
MSNPGEKTSLIDLIAGDEVIICEGYGTRTRATIQSITPAANFKVIQKGFTGSGVDTVRIFNKNGRERGSDIWHGAFLEPFDKAVWDWELSRRKRVRLTKAIREIVWDAYDNEVLEKVLAILPKEATNGSRS